jgi:hypothetical protein
MTHTEQLIRDIRGRALAVVKSKKGVNRPQLAIKAGVSYFWLCRFLAEHEDARNPTAENLSKLERAVDALERLQ